MPARALFNRRGTTLLVLRSWHGHIRPLVGLWSASLFVAGGSFLATVLIVAKAPVEDYAAYTVGLSVLALSAAFTDGGLANTLGVLAARHGNQKETLDTYRRIGTRFAWRMAATGFVASLLLVVVTSSFSGVSMNGVALTGLAGFALAGAVTSRASLYNSLTYACGNFHNYSIAQVAPTCARLLMLATALIASDSLGLHTILLITLLTSFLAMLAAIGSLARARRRIPSSQSSNEQFGAEREVTTFLRPTLFGVVLGAISYNVTPIAGSFFAPSASIAVYGVFLRLNQIVVTFGGPLNLYVARRLRLQAHVKARKRKSSLFIATFMAAYVIYALLALATYYSLGRYSAHYALGYPLEFSMFLVSNGLGYLQVSLDSVLASNGTAGHRIVGSLLACAFNVGLVFLIRPHDLLSMIVINILSAIPITVYYALTFVRLRADNGEGREPMSDRLLSEPLPPVSESRLA